MENIILLIKRNWLYERKSVINMSIIVFLVLFVISFIKTWTVAGNFRGQDNLSNIFNIIYVFTMLVSASGAFKEIHVSSKSHIYLMIPASNFEKLFAAWFSNSILSSLVLITVYGVGTLFGCGLASLIFNIDFYWGILSNHAFLHIMAIVLVVQTLYYCGGLFFKSNAFLRTSIYIILVPIILVFITALYFLIITGGFENLFVYGLSNDLYNYGINEQFRYFMKDVQPFVLRTLFWVITGPFFLTVSYFMLKESEV